MIVLALVFFFQKSASRQVSLVLAVLGAVAVTGAFRLTGGSSDDGDGGDVVMASSLDVDVEHRRRGSTRSRRNTSTRNTGLWTLP